MSTKSSLVSEIDESLSIRIYGKKMQDLALSASSDGSILQKKYEVTGLEFASVYGVMFLGECQKLPKPLLLLLPSNDVDPVGCGEFSDPKEFRMWTLPHDAPLVALEKAVGSANEIVSRVLRPRLDVNADFRVHDVRIDGTVVRGKLRAYLHLHQSGPFGSTIFDVTVVDRDDDFSINLVPSTCITVFSIGVASAQVCYRENPNRICGEAQIGIDLPVIGHWGQNFTIACVNF